MNIPDDAYSVKKTGSGVYKYYIVDGKAYDLSEWIDKHPGGRIWFAESNGRDISVAIHAYHEDSQKLIRILKKYEVDISAEEAIDPQMNVPLSMMPEGFDARKHVQKYDWNQEGFLSSLKAKIYTADVQKKIAKADFCFDFVSLSIFIFHILMMFFGVYYSVLPDWAFVVLFATTRTAMAGTGHYHCHRKKDGVSDWGDALFDMQYLATGPSSFAAHVMIHHLYTNSDADVERKAFRGVLDFPRLWRLPAYTLHRLGQSLTGTIIQLLRNSVIKGPAREWPPIKRAQYISVRFLLLAEFIFCWYVGHLWMWFGQFVLCIWWNLFLIFSTHDFENAKSEADSGLDSDWGVFQIKNSFDISVLGNPYIDCFLTAGLGCHRVHHVLPTQKSGFANIVSESAVKKTCGEFNTPWRKPRNFVWDRLPALIPFIVLTPMQLNPSEPPYEKGIYGVLQEAFAWNGMKCAASFAVMGFWGEGTSI